MVTLSGCVQQNIIKQEYSLLSNDGVIKKFCQQGDTSLQLNCFVDRPCSLQGTKHLKILASQFKGDYVIVKLESLNSVALSSNPLPATLFKVFVFKSINKYTLGRLPFDINLKQQQLDTLGMDKIAEH